MEEETDPRLGRLRIVAGVLVLLATGFMLLGIVLSARDPSLETDFFGWAFLVLGGLGIALFVTAWVLRR